jgi:hypothetical protein
VWGREERKKERVRGRVVRGQQRAERREKKKMR